MLIAVYGTLKTGEENYARFLQGRTPSLRGFVEIPYRMYSNGAYPMLVPAEGNSSGNWTFRSRDSRDARESRE